jgi:hypothetical protein
MVKQINNMEVQKVNIQKVDTMYEEIDLESFLISGPIGAHNLGSSLNVSP